MSKIIFIFALGFLVLLTLAAIITVLLEDYHSHYIDEEEDPNGTDDR